MNSLGSSLLNALIQWPPFDTHLFAKLNWEISSRIEPVTPD